MRGACPSVSSLLSLLVIYPVFLQNVLRQNDPIQNVPATKRLKPKNILNTKCLKPQNIPAIKCPKSKTSQLQNDPSQTNVLNPKRSKPQNVPSLKKSQIQNVPNLRTSKIPCLRWLYFSMKEFNIIHKCYLCSFAIIKDISNRRLLKIFCF